MSPATKCTQRSTMRNVALPSSGAGAVCNHESSRAGVCILASAPAAALPDQAGPYKLNHAGEVENSASRTYGVWVLKPERRQACRLRQGEFGAPALSFMCCGFSPRGSTGHMSFTKEIGEMENKPAQNIQDSFL